MIIIKSKRINRKAQVQIISVILLTGITIAAVSGTLWWGLPLLDKSKTNTDVTQAYSIMQEIKTAIDEVSSAGGSRVVNVNFEGELVIEGGNLLREAAGTITTNVPENRVNSITYTIITNDVTSAVGRWVSLDGFSPISQTLYSGNESNNVTLPIGAGIECEFNNLCASVGTVDINCDGTNMDLSSATSGNYLNAEGYRLEFVYCDGVDNSFATISGPEQIITGFSGVNDAGVIVVKTIPFGDKFKTIFKLVYRELDDLNDDAGKGYLTLITKKGNTILTSTDASTGVTLSISALDSFISSEYAENTGGSLIVNPVTASFGSS